MLLKQDGLVLLILRYVAVGRPKAPALQPYCNQLYLHDTPSFSQHFSFYIFVLSLQIPTDFFYFSVENSTAGAVIVEASLSCSIFMMRQKILYRKEVCPLRYIKVSTDQQYTMYLRSCGINISILITVYLFQNFTNF